MYRRLKAPRTSAPNQPSRPNPNAPLAYKDDRGKASVQQNLNPNAYFKCHQVGHFASNCPSRDLLMEELEENETEPVEPLEEEVYQAEDNLADKYEGEEELIEDLEEYDNTADSTIPKGTLEEDQVIEPSSETQEQPKINEDQVSLV